MSRPCVSRSGIVGSAVDLIRSSFGALEAVPLVLRFRCKPIPRDVVSKVNMRVSPIILITGLFGCWSTATAQTPPERGVDFGFRFEVGDCLAEKFDTFSGEFTKDLGGEPPRAATARFSLADSRMRTIYQAINQVRFFELPSVFGGVPPGLSGIRVSHPAKTYRLEVLNGGLTHSVVWKDTYQPTTNEADRLRALFSMIIAFIHERAEYQRLSTPIGGCE
jgi:hypothetical protein